MEGTAVSQAPATSQPIEAPAAQCPTSPIPPDTKYCAICTPMGKICPNEFPVSLDWDEDLKEEERKDNDKEEDVTLTGTKILKNKKGKIRK